MGEEENKPDVAAGKGKAGSKKFIILGIVVLLLAGGGYAGWNFFVPGKFLKKGDEVIAKTGESGEAMKMAPGIMHEMEPFIVNLLDQDGRRYLKTTVELQIGNKDEEKELVERIPQIRDAVLLLLTSKSFGDISTPEGKIQLRNELIARINQVLQRPTVRALYFTEFVVQ